MRKAIGFLFIIVILAGCSRRSRYDARGTMIGVDPLLCGCCGGIELIMDGDDSEYRIDSVKSISWHELSTMQFPRRIYFNYGSQTTCGNITHLTIEQYEMEVQ